MAAKRKLHHGIRKLGERRVWAEADRDRKRAYSDCCTIHIPAERAGTGLSLQVRTNPAETLEADVQAALKLGFTLHRRMTAKSPNLQMLRCA